MLKQTDPQEPELCATKSDFDWPTKCRLRRIVRCAKVGLRCVVSSRVPGRRDAALHEHALMSGVPCKDLFSQTWIWDLLSWKPCQWIFLSDSIGFCCVISVIVCKCCSLSLAVPLANNPTSSLQYNYPNCCTDTQDQPKQTYWRHLFDWTSLFYIAHLCLTFQTVGVQNPKYDCMQLPCCRHNTWKQWDNMINYFCLFLQMKTYSQILVLPVNGGAVCGFRTRLRTKNK